MKPTRNLLVRARALIVACAVPLLALLSWTPGDAAAQPTQGPGGPILVVTSPQSPFGTYYAEILRTEGLNAFAVADIGSVSAGVLTNYDVVILAPATLSSDQVTMFQSWVSGGGNLIAMAPDAQLAGLLGLTSAGGTLSNAYLLVDTSQSPGNGIVGQTMQFHGTASRFTLNGATAVATLYSDGTTATTNPAVTLRNVGSGKAAAFAYDLATSVVQTRQGNPAWAAQERDGFSPIRSNDKFYGNKAGDVSPDWIDLSKVSIPQADEQQRLLANLILQMNLQKRPLPRFWYFPNGKKAVVLMSGDDHANNGTEGRFNQFKSLSPVGCNVDNWECVRGTSYIYPGTPLSAAQAALYNTDGFEVGLHLNTGCADFTQSSLNTFYDQQIAEFTSKYTGIPAPITQRHHCIAWSDWTTAAVVQLSKGIRLDTSYYFWPPSWVNNVPGHFTGSAMPMRFAALDGTLIDVYMAATQMTDESGQSYPFTIDTLLDRAIGPEGQYGVYTINAHTDVATIPESNAVVPSALARGVPIVTARQMLTWLDGRNGSSFGSIGWNGSTLMFNVSTATGANGLQAMIPNRTAAGAVTSLTRGGTTVPFSVSVIKGVEYAQFAAAAGSYIATYAPDSTAPTVTATSPANGATGVSTTAAISATFSEAMDPATIGAGTFELRGAGNVLVPATVTWDAATLRATLTPAAPLAGQATYTATVKGGTTDPRAKDLSGNALGASVTWTFTTVAGPVCPCTIWPGSAVPLNPSENDPGAVELGVKFRSDINGYITGVRFYKGANNTGTHVGSLWTSAGTLLASATFTNETATGWQQVTFPSPVAITASTVYVASYFAPNGGYAGDNSGFAAAGVDSPPLHALRDGVSGGNGVYRYGPSSGFPTASFQATNYWVDVMFTTSVGADSTPPSVTTVTPANGALGVAASTTVTAVFSEPLDPATIGTGTFDLRDTGGGVVPATVVYSAATLTATLTPSAPLANATTYTATVKGGAADPRVKDIAGNALAANVTWGFTTSLVPETTPPAVSSTTPASGAVGVALTSSVNAVFNESLDATTVNGATFVLSAGGAPVLTTVTYDAPTRTATLTPASPLAASTVYTATLKGGATDPRIKDVAGNALAADFVWLFTTGVAGGPCAAPANPIVAENCLAGNPASEWDIVGAGSASIQGFATDISVNRGQTVSFKVNTTATSYRFDIYRMGYYGGAGARKVATVSPSAALPQSQPPCLNDAATGLIDCGNWAVSGSWAVPANAVSGIYFAKVVNTANNNASHIVFVVRDDASTADLLFQTSDTTWQAYNSWGGNSLYTGSPLGRALKVSYNRPFNTRSVDNGQDWLFATEYPMVRWLESNGYNVAYFTGVDSDRRGAQLLNHKAFLSTGHDEYWSGAQRANVEAARNAGRHMAFFSGNEVFWKTRWENSIDGSGTSYRTLVSYKETKGDVVDPTAVWTGTWRDPTNSPPKDGGRPENALTGQIFTVNDGATTSITVPAEDGKMRFWRNTSVATLPVGGVATLPFGTLGYEWDSDLDNGFRPPGTIRMSTTVVPNAPILLDYGNTYGTGTATHNLTLYKHASGALVFGAGTVQWSWGLDATHDRAGTPSDVRMQQATVNLFADMSVQPATLQAGLVPASPSTDATAPTSSITSPAPGATLTAGVPVAITGTATDAGGGIVGGVEVSVDGGTTWRAATGRGNWTFTWTPATNGNVTLRSRAADDSGSLETPAAGVAVTVGASGPVTCPCTIWPVTAVPSVLTDSDTAAVNLGVKFTADSDGQITGIRFYKGTANTGTHTGHLWTSAGVLLGSVTFTNESASGWQQANFAAPIPISANTVYVASYHAPVGRYSADSGYFIASSFDRPPLHALRDGTSGGNGVYAYGSAPAFPNSTYGSSNYWVDVVYTTGAGGSDTTPPTDPSGLTATANGSAGINLSWTASTDNVGVTGYRVERCQGAGCSNFAEVATPTAITFGDTGLTAGTSYSYRVRARDAASNNSGYSTIATATTGTAPDTTAPTAPTGLSATANGSTGINLTWTASTDAVGVTGYFVERCLGSTCATFVQVGTPTTTSFADSGLAASTTYRYRVRAGDAVPNLSNYSGIVSATTTAAPDTTPPTVASHSPLAGGTGFVRTANITVTFSEAMTASTINTTTIELRDVLTNSLVTSTVSYSSTTRTATLNPSPTLASNSEYTVIVKGGLTDPRVKDSAGIALATNYTWSFRTEVDTTPPTVSSRSPAINATGVSRTANVTATFNEPMDASTISTTTFELKDPLGNIVPAVVSYSSTSRVATLNPTPTLAYLTTYSATVKGGAKDVSGNALAADVSWSFTTVADTTPPTVSSVSPTANATNVSRTTNVTATFSEAMDPTTINALTVVLRDAAGVPVPAFTIGYDAVNRRVTFDPSPTLAGTAVYTATIVGGTSGVKDAQGVPLAVDRVWSFTTRL